MHLYVNYTSLWYVYCASVSQYFHVAGSFPEVKGAVVQQFPTEDRKEAPLPAGFEIVSSGAFVFAQVQCMSMRYIS